MAPVSQKCHNGAFSPLTIQLRDGVDTKILREWSSSRFEKIRFQQCPVFVENSKT